MSRIMLHRIRLTLSVRINQLCNNEAIIADAVRLCNCKRITLHGLDGSPHVDNLYAVLEELFGVFREVVRDSRFGGSVRLIDMHALDGAAETTSCVDNFLVGRLTADGMVEDENARGTSAVVRSIFSSLD